MTTIFEQLFIIVTSGGITLGFFIALLLNSRRVKKSRANLFLSILLISLSFSIAHILYAAKVIHHLSAKIYSLGDPTFLLIAPLLWLYASELTGQKTRLSVRLTLHFIPFCVIVFFSLTFKYFQSEIFAQAIDRYHRLFNIFFWILVVTQFTWYLVSLHKKLRRHRLLMKQEVSNTEDINISWIRFFMKIFLVINLFFLFSLFAVIHLENRAWHEQTTALLFSISVFALGFKGVLQKEIFIGSENPDSAEPSPASSCASSKPDQELINKLLLFMKNEKPYLNPELTLTSLAKSMNISRSQLSQLINSGIGNNFYDFVNKYRVEEVKRLMTEPQVKHFSLLGFALEAGFKSKSTFNLIFKRFTGLTPSEYRRNLLS